jgi:hypothetical protein
MQKRCPTLSFALNFKEKNMYFLKMIITISTYIRTSQSATLFLPVTPNMIERYLISRFRSDNKFISNFLLLQLPQHSVSIHLRINRYQTVQPTKTHNSVIIF